MPVQTPPRLILASTSPYRRALLERLGLDFEVVAPHVDEAPAPGESPHALCVRLARAKALAVARSVPAAVVIGSDQVAEIDGLPVNKPETHAEATRQLRMLRGRTVRFHTALCILQLDPERSAEERVVTDVVYRLFDDAAIERYLLRDRPYDCAGSAKVEGLGIVLTDAVRGDDPTALIGLPLIALTRLLPRFGLSML
ncbi:MAG: Maf family nucleotide pyrophosphatase [Burkholderiales bacterium]|jgi:septum formation protein|nr:Maf family nucleotide pyrophosphatase [Burkholderiales bacterium]